MTVSMDFMIGLVADSISFNRHFFEMVLEKMRCAELEREQEQISDKLGDPL